MFTSDAKSCTAWAPHRFSNLRKTGLTSIQSSGMNSFDISYARQFCSLGTHSTDNVTLCTSPNPKKLPRQFVQFQPQAAAFDDFQYILRVYREDHKLANKLSTSNTL